MLNSPLARSTVAGVAGFAVYGGWAAYANLDHGSIIAMRSGLVQGSYSLVLTFLMSFATEELYKQLSVLWMTVAVVCLILFSTAYGIHHLVGTPEILMSILPGFVIGSIYTWVYVWGLQHGTKMAIEG